MTRDRADVIRQKILEKSRGQRSEGSEKRRAEVKAQKDRIKIEENLAKKSEKEIVVLEKKKDAVDQLMVQYDQAGSRKRKKAIQEKIAPALFNLYKGLGVANPMGRVSKEMKAAEESGAWYKPNKFDPEKVNKTAVATPTDSTSSAQAEVDQLEAEIAELERQKGK